MPRLPFIAAVSFVLGLLALSPAGATTYPLTVTDAAGRSVTIPHAPQRLALQDGRDVMMLALLDRANPTARVKVWNNLERRDDATTWALIARKWPAANDIPDMGFGDDGEVNPEMLVAAQPDLVIAELRTRGALESEGVTAQLAALHIPLLFVDTFVHPVPGTTASITMLGQVLNREAEAKAYTDFYNAHLAALTSVTAAQPRKARLFIEPLAGRSGPDQCCFTHGHVGWGALLDAIGVDNIGGDLLHSPTGDVTLETILAQQPDAYIMTGAQGKKSLAVFARFGYAADPAQIGAALGQLEQRPGFAELSAAKNGRVFGVWHLFYSSPFNIVGMEYLAKFAYPAAFATLDPAATYRQIIRNFTTLPAAPFIFAAKAPAAP